MSTCRRRELLLSLEALTFFWIELGAMQFAQLSTVRDRIKVGAPMPFNVRNADKTLLLARGQIISSESQLELLFERGALVDVEELNECEAQSPQTNPTQLPALWGMAIDRLSQLLCGSVHQDFKAKLDEVAQPILSLIERDPNLAIFQVVRQEAPGKAAYGVTHSMDSAIASFLAARRLGWDGAMVEKVFNAALTMNWSIIELQSRLATQMTPLTTLQREAIHQHPLHTARLLEESGVTDHEWIDAVVQHHEVLGGKGYPRMAHEVSELAGLLRRVEIYTAKLSPRTLRAPLAASQAGRELFISDQGHPMAAAIVKEFGIYPPGCCVRLRGGEVAIVIRRGENANTPLVAALTSRKGEFLSEPVCRDTALHEFTIVGSENENTLNVRLVNSKLMMLACSPNPTRA